MLGRSLPYIHLASLFIAPATLLMCPWKLFHPFYSHSHWFHPRLHLYCLGYLDNSLYWNMVGDCMYVWNEVGEWWLTPFTFDSILHTLSFFPFSSNYLWAEPSKVLSSRHPLNVMQLNWFQTTVRNNLHIWAIGSYGKEMNLGLLWTYEVLWITASVNLPVPHFPNL